MLFMWYIATLSSICQPLVDISFYFQSVSFKFKTSIAKQRTLLFFLSKTEMWFLGGEFNLFIFCVIIYIHFLAVSFHISFIFFIIFHKFYLLIKFLFYILYILFLFSISSLNLWKQYLFGHIFSYLFYDGRVFMNLPTDKIIVWVYFLLKKLLKYFGILFPFSVFTH